MFSRISRNSNRILAVLSQNRKPYQIAWGVAIGVMVGLIPKDNLVALSLLAMIACLRVNQLIACVAAVAIHGLSSMLGSITGFVGAYLLGQSVIAGGIVFLYQFPVLPWTCFENALVLGGLGVGIMTLLPTYVICRWSLSIANRQLEHIALEQVVDNAIQYRKTVADQSRTRQDKPLPTLKLLTQNENASAAPSGSSKQTDEPTQVANQSAKPPVTMANKKAENGTFVKTGRKIQQRVLPTIFTGESQWDGNETILRETVIEVVRYRCPSPAEKLPKSNNEHSSAVSPTQGISMPAGKTSTVTTDDKESSVFSSASNVSPSSPSLSFDSSHAPKFGNGRDESLRYLLWHINGTRETGRKSPEKSA